MAFTRKITYTPGQIGGYTVDESGNISEVVAPERNGGAGMDSRLGYQASKKAADDFFNRKKDAYKNIAEANNASQKIIKEAQSKQMKDFEKRLTDTTLQENERNSLAQQIAAITGGGQGRPSMSQSASQLSADNTFGASDLSTKLNFQVSDQDIINDYNNTKLGRLNRIIDDGNSQIAGINSRLEAAQSLYDQLPAKDPRRTSAKLSIDQLKSDLTSVQNAVTKAGEQVKNFVPVSATDNEGLKQITSFREFIKLPEQRASDQLRQIDPEAYRTAVGLGRQYRQMATQPLGATTTPQTEELRNTLEQEALNQLRLGSTLGAEERRGYEQAIRQAQTARGNIFGLGPAVQEAAQLGAAGEQRKLARYGAAQQFLSSGETTGAAAARDLALREGLQQSRLGAAAGFIAGGPSLYNLANQRLAQQNAAFQNYVNANQAQPGQFQTQGMPQQFYQTANPAIPVQLAGNAASIYNATQAAQADMYGAYTRAVASQPNAFQNFATLAGGFKDLAGGVGGLASAGILCWVAREVYGIENPKWLQFRKWMLTKASDNLRNFYIKYGERIAKSIRNKPKIKAIIRKWMDSKIG
jgi:hypothetical protein